MRLNAAVRARLQAAYRRLKAGASIAPSLEYRPIRLALRGSSPQMIGRASPEIFAALSSFASFDSSASGLLLRAADGTEASALLAAINEALLSRRLLPAFRREMLDLAPLTQDGASHQPLARMERSAFRAFGARTRTVRLTALLDAPQQSNFEDAPVWLFAKRSDRKLFGAGLWDSLAAGMIAADETPLAALEREAEEEAGLLDALRLPTLREMHVEMIERPIVNLAPGWMSEASIEFAAELPSGFEPRAVDGEVEEFRAFTISETLDLIDANAVMPEAALAFITAALHFDAPQQQTAVSLARKEAAAFPEPP